MTTLKLQVLTTSNEEQKTLLQGFYVEFCQRMRRIFSDECERAEGQYEMNECYKFINKAGGKIIGIMKNGKVVAITSKELAAYNGLFTSSNFNFDQYYDVLDLVKKSF